MRLVLFATFAVIALTGCQITTGPYSEQVYKDGVYEFKNDYTGTHKMDLYLSPNNKNFIGEYELNNNTPYNVQYNEEFVCFGENGKFLPYNSERYLPSDNNCYRIEERHHKMIISSEEYQINLAKREAKRKAKEEAEKAKRAKYANVKFDTFKPADPTDHYCKTLANNAQTIYQNRMRITHIDAIRAASTAHYQMIINAIYYRGYVPNKDADLRDCLYYSK
ncbi:hypothetical protein [Pseudoalteromonas sp. BDTF-M6]|uniref:hypothetical protein n=1 Tax=Pseudoalteromonas sp. BDTF-M6 TaxID=2796132 RepID=UPI001BAE8EC7|nr:hypothetical protein [Pseudoalteromonas sp. BDTF-M6]MBS3798110.1 hypothetical protein [Pseudoalteromonas sp. BDTF-M6]